MEYFAKGGGCFIGNTEIATPKGKKYIQWIKPGDEIYSHNESTGENEVSKVGNVHVVAAREYFVINGKVQATGEHPFYTPGGIKRVKDLRIGDELRKDRITVKIHKIECVQEDVVVYNLLDVEPNNNYYAEGFANLYPVEAKKTKVTLYKSVHKRDGKYIADYDNKTEYVVGKTIKGEIDVQHTETCSRGLHVAHKQWAINFGRWEDQALLECEVPISKIIVAKDTDGKVRTSELKVLREVPREEW